MSDSAPQLLVVDDEPGMLSLVQRFAEGQGFDVVTRPGGLALLTELPGLNPDAALLDRNMPEVGGLELLKAIRESDPGCQVILMTAEADGGVRDRSGQARRARLLEQAARLRPPARAARRRRATASPGGSGCWRPTRSSPSRFEFYGMVGRGPVMQELFDLMRRLAPHARTALVTGETGTGKELVARALHKLGPRKRSQRSSPSTARRWSKRCRRASCSATCAAPSRARPRRRRDCSNNRDGGTLFLDEIGELPLPIQAKLLRVDRVRRSAAGRRDRQPRRWTSASSPRPTGDLPQEVAAGRFRQDLYYRLNVVEIRAAAAARAARRHSLSHGGVRPGVRRAVRQARSPA